MTSAQSGPIEVIAATEAEALEQAAQATGLEVAELQVLRREPLSRLPWQAQRRRFWVVRRPPPRESRDGWWSLDYQGGRALLTVHPPVGSGAPVMPEEVLAARRTWAVSNIDRERLYRIIERASGTPQPIAAYEIPQGAFGVLVSADEMTAYLVFGAAWDRQDPLGSALGALQKAGVVHGLDAQRVEDALRAGAVGKVAQIARGTPPQPGRDARLLSTESPASPQVRPDGTLDLAGCRFDQLVQAGEALLAVDPAEPGHEGRTVRGQALPTTLGRPIDLSPYMGDGVAISPDGLRLVAAIPGTLSRFGPPLAIRPLLRIEERLDAERGEVRFEGNVLVDGDALDGARAIAGGDLMVKGAAHGAHLEAAGAVVLANGMLGHGQGVIRAGRLVEARFLEECRVESGGDIHVTREIVACEVRAAESVVVSGEGRIVGGQVVAGEEILARSVGTPRGRMTRLAIEPASRWDRPGAPSGRPQLDRSPPRPMIRVRDQVFAPAEIAIGPAKLVVDRETPFCKFIEENGSVEIAPYS